MNDQELTAVVRQSLEGAHMDVPEDQITSRSRAIRAARRRRVAASVTAVAAAGAAAVTAAVFLPGSAASPVPAVEHAEDTAYVVSHVTRALDAVPAGNIMFTQQTTGPHSEVKDTWGRGSQLRVEYFTPTGQLASEVGADSTSKALTTVGINYQARTWGRSTTSRPAVKPSAQARAASSAAASSACANPLRMAISQDASQAAAWIRTLVSCHALKADGTTTVDGVTAIKLTMANGEVWYVNSGTYLPFRMTLTRPGIAWQDDFQWLAPTTANLAKLSLPATPQGFTQVTRQGVVQLGG
jgi:hypothetical protein